jgi:hypothetical protein
MSYYRLYFMNGATNQIDRFHAFESTDDEAAIARSEDFHGWRTMELWNRSRRVRRWENQALTMVPA